MMWVLRNNLSFGRADILPPATVQAWQTARMLHSRLGLVRSSISRHGWQALGVLLAVGTTSLPQQAQACQPCSCDAPYGLRPHADSLTEVPLNARFLVELTAHSPEGGETKLERSDIRWTNLDTSQRVDVDVVETAGSAGQVWLVPRQELPADNEFELQVGGTDKPHFSERFRTSSDSDTSPPSVNLPRIEQEFASGACGEFLGAHLIWDAIHDDDAAVAYDPVVQVTVTSRQGKHVLFADATHLGAGRGVILAAPTDVSGIDCWNSFALPATLHGERLSVAVAVYDRAGNQTELPPFELTLTANPGGTCLNDEGDCHVAAAGASSRTAGLLWLFALGAAAAALRGKKRPQLRS